MVQRLINRGKTSGRADDNEETIRSRLNTFEKVDTFNLNSRIRNSDENFSFRFRTLLHFIYSGDRSCCCLLQGKGKTLRNRTCHRWILARRSLRQSVSIIRQIVKCACSPAPSVALLFRSYQFRKRFLKLSCQRFMFLYVRFSLNYLYKQIFNVF